MAKADNKLHFHCQCGTKLEATWKSKGLLGKKQWIADVCHVCHKRADLSNVQVFPCPKCQSIVIKGEKFCPKCDQLLDVSTENQPIACPNEHCGVTLYLPKNYQGDYTCPGCQTVVKADYIRAEMRKYHQEEAPAKLITLPDLAAMDDRALVVYREAEEQFPFMSRVVVSEGTYGLLRQNGVCQYPLSPGSHLLEDSKLTKTARFEAAMNGEDAVFNTEIFCVVKALPEIGYRLKSAPVEAKPVGEVPARAYTVEASAAIRCTVDDPKAFAARFDFRETSKGEVAAEGGWLHERTQLPVSAAFDQAAREAFEVYAAGGSVYAYTAELTQRVKTAVYSALADDGLSIDDIQLGDVKVTETEESVRRQQAYEEKRNRIETVKLPDVKAMQAQGLVIYQHDKDEFEYKSRVQVSEGTYGLLLQNGACESQLTPGSYPLAECALEGTSRYDAALQGEKVVFYSSLFSVVRMLPGFEWYHRGAFIDTDAAPGAPSREYNVCAEGTLRFQVDDAKAFATQVELRTLSVAELFHAHRPKGQLPALNVEIEQDYPGENKDGWLYTRVKSIMNTVFGAACRGAIGPRLDARQMDVYRMDFIRRLREAFNEELRGTGLSVAALELASFSASETEESKARLARAEHARKNHEELFKAAQTQFHWTARNVELHLKDQQAASFSLTFDGDCRLRVADEQQFFALPEVRRSQEADTPDAVRAFLQDKVQRMIGLHLAHLAQDFINQGKIDDPLDRYAYRQVTEYVQDKIDRELALDGLRIHYLNVGLPDGIQPSKALEDYLAVSKKKEKIRQYAESRLDLKTDAIRVHMKDDATVYVKAVFSASAYLRVEDPEVFYETSEVKGFLASDPFVSAQAVTGYYAARINPLFADMVARIAQAIVDQTNADIRELHRLNGLLQSNLVNHMAALVSALGMRLDALNMGMPRIEEQSENMLTWTKAHDVRSSVTLQKEIDRLEHDKTIFDYDEGNRVDVARATSDSEKSHKLNDILITDLDSNDHVEDKKAELDAHAAERAKQRMEREFQAQMERTRKQDELDRLVEDIASGRKERSFEETRKEYERKYILQEQAINQTIREAQIRQQGDLDAQAREDRAQFDRVLNAAENKRLLGDILRKIAESDLDWRKKLDEYARLQRKVNAADQGELDLLRAKNRGEIDVVSAQAGADAARIIAAADTEIKRANNETFLMVGETKIKLTAAEAELMETIARYNEDRRQRILDHKEDHDERRANLDFEHRMRERQEAVAQKMELLRQEHEYELALRDRDDKLAEMDHELQKLQYILNYLTREIGVKGDVDKTRIRADEEIRKAEAQYKAQHEQAALKAQEDRLQKQQEYDEAAAKRAAEYQKMMADIQLAIEKLHHETERNRDDNQAKVAIAQTQSEHKQEAEDAKRAFERLTEKMDKRYSELHRAMEKIVDSQNRLKDKVKGLTGQHGQPLQPQPGTYPVWVGGQPMGPSGATAYSQRQALDDLAVTGGLGASAPAQPIVTGSAYAPGMKPAAPYGAQPGMATQTCPICGHACSAQAAICEHCGASL